MNMENVLTLVAPDDGLDDRVLARVRSVLEDLGADTLSPKWLAKGRAADLPFSLLSTCQAEAATRQALDGRIVDVVAQQAGQRRKLLLVADMDSTILAAETLDELSESVDLKARIAPMTARAMNGETDFASSLRERVALLAGLPVDCLEQTYRRISYTPGARTLVATMKAHGAFTVLVSGGFRFFTARVREHCGFDRDLANDLEITEGRLSGRVADPLLDASGKLQALIAAATERKLPLARTLAVGDGANDLPMIQAAGLGIAFHAKPSVAADSRARIDHADLRALLFIQGYREDEFVG